jgi:GT2 family glycosyltransferase
MNHTEGMHMEHPRLGILILNFNGRRWLAPLFASIHANGYPNIRIYLVDNASDDGSVEMTLADHSEVTVLRMSQNLGYCMAYNLAMPYAIADGCEWLVWANNDVLLEPGCLGNLVRTCADHPGIGVAGPAFLAWDGDGPNAYMMGNHGQAIQAVKNRSRIPLDVEWVEGSFLMLNRSCVEKVGHLDPYLGNYWEEADFCRRARFHGCRVVLVPNALARHYGAASWTSEEQKRKRRRLLARNHYVFKLTDPQHSFVGNILATLHLFGVCAKKALVSLSLVEEVRYFGEVLLELPTIHRKWSNDRAGRQPSPAVGAFASAAVEILRGANPSTSPV